ncbi:uncharacterized protein BKA55DRAFT_626377 [Fusarium redolens]|uniref:Uncharacterized protein n=1 Tax=Fusarium redolens TaxID=48865 RepID=A0A9P9JLX1_FUSRE|nr:uncharacterized protein BKA55DRAFT_626377 [Fusarium redolens]KAH7228489.1 hypothetical protein BKA55DRAFT_626377 [Fusarium redolens]
MSLRHWSALNHGVGYEISRVTRFERVTWNILHVLSHCQYISFLAIHIIRVMFILDNTICAP